MKEEAEEETERESDEVSRKRTKASTFARMVEKDRLGAYGLTPTALCKTWHNDATRIPIPKIIAGKAQIIVTIDCCQALKEVAYTIDGCQLGIHGE